MGSTDSNLLRTFLFRARMQISSCDFHTPSTAFAVFCHEPEVMAPHCGRKDVVRCLMYVRPLATGDLPSTPVKAETINGHTPRGYHTISMDPGRPCTCCCRFKIGKTEPLSSIDRCLRLLSLKLSVLLVMTACHADCQCEPCSCRYVEVQRPTFIYSQCCCRGSRRKTPL